MNEKKVKQISKDEFLDEEKIGSKGISYSTIGTTLQALSVQLDENECIYSEAGKMSWMTDNIELTTHGQGCSRMFSRFFSNESIFVNKFTCTGGTGIVTFATDQAGKLIPLKLSEGTPGIIFQRGAYLCSEEGVDRTTALIKKISTGLFGGKGFILQRVTGTGWVHLIADGEVAMYELKDGEQISVDQGNLIAYEETVDFDIKTISGPKNWFISGEGVFVGLLKGPGKVWLQTRKNQLGQLRGYPNRSQSSIGQIIGILISLGFLSCFFISILLEFLSKK